jgi:hypothetical protein
MTSDTIMIACYVLGKANLRKAIDALIDQSAHFEVIPLNDPEAFELHCEAEYREAVERALVVPATMERSRDLVARLTEQLEQQTGEEIVYRVNDDGSTTEITINWDKAEDITHLTEQEARERSLI